MPAVLIEVAFISNPKEEKLLGTPAFRQQAAEGIYQGILAYKGA
ncbi:N-acetylmuramoyl-L-alanine amidase family protein [Acididesulfobacillus acetoxydans]|nr:N-acetylmuramoyl-L-alanine amidase [Acididesulfobacillus acetoxydans]